jgi:tetratricopeptide (TPR) repeat protein
VRFPDEQHARAELNYLAAGAYSLQLKFRMARQHAEQADAIFRTLTTEAGSIDPGVDLANLSILLTSFFHLAEWSEKDAYFSLARHLAEQAPNAREWYARFDWLEALFYRWNGQLKRAYLLASAGARTLKEIGSPRAVMHLSRLNSVVADIALDLVEFHEDRASSDANTYVSIGQTYAREALELSLQTNHISNKNMALLASARHDGLINCNTNRLFVIENVWKQAEYYKDDTLVAQVYTNLGIEFEAQKERDLAATCYRQAIARTELADIPTMGVLAHRRLRVQQEMYV